MLSMRPEYIRRKILATVNGATVEELDAAIDRASGILQNLVHYRTGSTYQDEDIARLAVEFLQYDDLIRGLKRGSCWCEAGIDNPMMAGRHSDVCKKAQTLVAS